MSIPDMGLHKYLSEHIDTYKTTTILNAQKRQIASYGDTEFCSADIIFRGRTTNSKMEFGKIVL